MNLHKKSLGISLKQGVDFYEKYFLNTRIYPLSELQNENVKI